MTTSIQLSAKWEVPSGPAKSHLDTQLFPECAGKWCDRDIVKKNRRRNHRTASLSDGKREGLPIPPSWAELETLKKAIPGMEGYWNTSVTKDQLIYTLWRLGVGELQSDALVPRKGSRTVVNLPNGEVIVVQPTYSWKGTYGDRMYYMMHFRKSPEPKGDVRTASSDFSPKITEMVEIEAKLHADDAKGLDVVRAIVPADRLDSFIMDAGRLGELWLLAIRRFFMIDPEPIESKRREIVAAALAGVDWRAHPQARRLHDAFLVPATIKCVKEAIQPRGSLDDTQRWEQVESSVVDEVSYHPGLKFLDVRLKDGRRLTFKGVGSEEYRAFMASPSKGEYFNKLKKEHRASATDWYLKARTSLQGTLPIS